MAKDGPLFTLAATVSVYWITVVLLALHKRLRHGQGAGFIPRQRVERRLWWFVVPMVIAWIAVPILAYRGSPHWLALPFWTTTVPLAYAVRWVAASLAVAAYGLSLWCWLLLGRNWSMAVIPEQDDAQLVTTGMYRWARHPIYSLSILLMFATVLALPTAPMVFVASVHFLVMQRKARNEERHLHARFGSSYTRYCATVGRFWPRWS